MTINIELLEQAIGLFKGKKIYQTRAGVDTGFALSIALGNKRQYTVEISGKPKRRYTGEFSMYLHIPWRIRKNNNILCGSGDENGKGKKMLEGLKSIKGCSILDIQVDKYSSDLRLHLDDNIIFETLRDSSFENSDYFVYLYLFFDAYALSIGGNSGVFIDKCDGIPLSDTEIEDFVRQLDKHK
jgi:hypothetical protein